MPATVTVTRTTTTTSSASMIVINTGYLKTVPGLLKFIQLILGIVNVALISSYIDNRTYLQYQYLGQEIFFLNIAVTFMLGTFIIVLSCLLSLATATVVQKTTYEYMYHVIGFLLYLVASLVLLIDTIQHDNRYQREYGYDLKIAASVIGIIVSILYLATGIQSYRTYRIG